MANDSSSAGRISTPKFKPVGPIVVPARQGLL